ncbi:MAG: hypothetical protein ACOCQE_01880 [Halanaerobium sp.]
MDHLVYLDAKANELEKLFDGSKSMIIRGAAGRKLPYGRVNEGDVLYFINNNSEGLVKARAIVDSVFNSEKMSKEESTALVEKHQSKLNLSESQFKKWAGKRYIVLIAVKNIEEVKSFAIDKSDYRNMDDWLPVEKISSVKK